MPPPIAIVGDVVVASDGSDSGSGLSYEIYAEQILRETMANPQQPPAGWPGTANEWAIVATTALVASKTFYAKQAISYATALVPYFNSLYGNQWVWRGRWNTVNTYAVNHVVFYNGTSYIAVTANTNVRPYDATTDTYAPQWNVFTITCCGDDEPIVSTGPKLWCRDDAITVDTGGGDLRAEQWTDKTGNNNHIIKYDDNSRMRFYASGGPLNRAYLSSDGGACFMVGPAWSGLVTAAAFTIFAVIRINSTATNDSTIENNEAILGDTGNKIGLHVKANGGNPLIVAYSNDGDRDEAADFVDANAAWVVVRMRKVGGSLFIKVGSASEVVDTSAGSITSLTGLLRLMRNAATDNANADIAELMIYDRALTTDESIFIDNYHADYFFGTDTFYSINVGEPPFAQTGKVRIGTSALPENQKVLTQRNANDDGDIPLISTDPTDNVLLGGKGAESVRIRANTVAQRSTFVFNPPTDSNNDADDVGTSAWMNIRKPYTTGSVLAVRSADRAHDINLLFMYAGADQFYIGDSSYLQALAFSANGSIFFQPGGGGATLYLYSSRIAPAVPISYFENYDATFTIETRGSDALPKTVFVTGQSPFATATGANRKPGDVIVSVGTPTNGGTTYGSVTIKNAGTTVFDIGRDATSLVDGWFITGNASKGYFEQTKTVQVRTTTAGQTAAAITYTPPNGCSVSAHAIVMGDKEDGTDDYGYDRVSKFKKTTGGVLSEKNAGVDNTTNIYPASASGVAAELDVSGASIVVNVMGPTVAANWVWTVTLTVTIRSFTWTP